MKPNRWTFIGACIGLTISVVTAPFIFGLVFGILFFFVNAILFGLKLINEPSIMMYFYLGIAIVIIYAVFAIIVGIIVGTKHGENQVH